MRKYQQLFLLIISFFCFISFLFYRHEYLRLQSVLNVLNFFGSVPASSSTCFVLSNDTRRDSIRRYNYLEPRSSWTKFDRHFVYSSFWENSPSGAFVRTLAVGPMTSFSSYSCRVWFEKGDIIISKAGRFRYDLDSQSISIKEKNKLRKYFLKCYVEAENDHGRPYGVLWISPTDSSNVFSPVFVKKAAPDEPVICVKPDYSGLAKTNLIEFLSFYNQIGISNLIIYESGIQHTLYPFLEAVMSHREIFRSLTVLQWNFPLTDFRLEDLSLKDDCLSRTFGVTKLVGIVSWNEYIFPVGANISSLRRNSDELADLYLNTQLCCTNYPDESSSKVYWPEFLRKTRCVQSPSTAVAFVNSQSYVNARKHSKYETPPKVATMHRYESCAQLPMNSSVVSLPSAYANVASHPLLQTWKSYVNSSAIFY